MSHNPEKALLRTQLTAAKRSPGDKHQRCCCLRVVGLVLP